MVGSRQHFEDAPHDPVAPLDGLIRIGVGADSDGARAIDRVGELALERYAGVGLCEQLGLEVEPRRQAKEGVGGPREAIDAAMLAAAIRINRSAEADIGRRVPRDDPPRRDLLHFGGQGLELGKRLPAVVQRLITDRLIAAGSIGRSPPPVAAVGSHASNLEREAVYFSWLSKRDRHVASYRDGMRTNQEHNRELPEIHQTL